MTDSEAIEYLTAYLECESRRSRIESCNNNCNECELCYLQGTAKQHLESIKIAIQALEEVQQYRQFDTVEECSEAAEKQNPKEPAYDVDKIVEELNKIKKYNLNLTDMMLDIQRNGTNRHFICLEDAIEIVKAGGKYV